MKFYSYLVLVCITLLALSRQAHADVAIIYLGSGAVDPAAYGSELATTYFDIYYNSGSKISTGYVYTTDYPVFNQEIIYTGASSISYSLLLRFWDYPAIGRYFILGEATITRSQLTTNTWKNYPSFPFVGVNAGTTYYSNFTYQIINLDNNRFFQCSDASAGTLTTPTGFHRIRAGNYYSDNSEDSDNTEDCTLTISVTGATSIQLKFHYFSTEATYDTLVISRGSTTFYTLSGNPSTLTYTISGSSLTLHFTSDTSNSGKGYLLEYTALYPVTTTNAVTTTPVTTTPVTSTPPVTTTLVTTTPVTSTQVITTTGVSSIVTSSAATSSNVASTTTIAEAVSTSSIISSPSSSASSASASSATAAVVDASSSLSTPSSSSFLPSSSAFPTSSTSVPIGSQESASSSPVAAIAGAVIGVVVLAIFLVIVLITYRKRKQRTAPKPDLYNSTGAMSQEVLTSDPIPKPKPRPSSNILNIMRPTRHGDHRSSSSFVQMTLSPLAESPTYESIGDKDKKTEYSTLAQLSRPVSHESTESEYASADITNKNRKKSGTNAPWLTNNNNNNKNNNNNNNNNNGSSSSSHNKAAEALGSGKKPSVQYENPATLHELNNRASEPLPAYDVPTHSGSKQVPDSTYDILTIPNANKNNSNDLYATPLQYAQVSFDIPPSPSREL